MQMDPPLLHSQFVRKAPCCCGTLSMAATIIAPYSFHASPSLIAVGESDLQYLSCICIQNKICVCMPSPEICACQHKLEQTYGGGGGGLSLNRCFDNAVNLDPPPPFKARHLFEGACGTNRCNFDLQYGSISCNCRWTVGCVQ